MVQGTTKGLRSKASNNARRSHKAAANTRKGRRVVAPKKAAAITQASMHKVGTVALIPNFPFPYPLLPIPTPSQSPSPCSHTIETELSFWLWHQALSAKINKSVEQQMVNAASSGKLTIMKNVGTERWVRFSLIGFGLFSFLYCALLPSVFASRRQQRGPEISCDDVLSFCVLQGARAIKPELCLVVARMIPCHNTIALKHAFLDLSSVNDPAAKSTTKKGSS